MVIVCASGIAGTVHLEDGVKASTVHSFHGLRNVYCDLGGDLGRNKHVEQESVRTSK